MNLQKKIVVQRMHIQSIWWFRLMTWCYC